MPPPATHRLTWLRSPASSWRGVAPGRRTGAYCALWSSPSGGERTSCWPPVSEFSITRDVTISCFSSSPTWGFGKHDRRRDFQPLLAERGSGRPRRWCFNLDPRPVQDGQAVTAADVAFTYDAYTDTLVNSSFRSSLRQIAAVTTRDSLNGRVPVPAALSRDVLRCVYHLRILPRIPARGAARSVACTTFGRAPLATGPTASSRGRRREHRARRGLDFFLGRPHLRRVIWRFTSDQQVAVTPAACGPRGRRGSY